MKTTKQQAMRTIRESARVLLRGSVFALLLAVAGWLVTSQELASETAQAPRAQQRTNIASSDDSGPEWLLPTTIERPLPAARLSLSRGGGDGSAPRLSFEAVGVPHRLSAWLAGLLFQHERLWPITGFADRPVVATCPARGPPSAA